MGNGDKQEKIGQNSDGEYSDRVREDKEDENRVAMFQEQTPKRNASERVLSPCFNTELSTEKQERPDRKMDRRNDVKCLVKVNPEIENLKARCNDSNCLDYSSIKYIHSQNENDEMCTFMQNPEFKIGKINFDGDVSNQKKENVNVPFCTENKINEDYDCLDQNYEEKKRY